MLEIDGEELRFYVVDAECAAATKKTPEQPSQDPVVPPGTAAADSLPTRECKGVLTDTLELPKLQPNHEARFAWFWENSFDVPQRGGETDKQSIRCTIDVTCRVAGTATPQTNIDDFIQLSLNFSGPYDPNGLEPCMPGAKQIARSKDTRVAGLVSRGQGPKGVGGGRWVFNGPVKEADFRPKAK